MQEIQSKAEAEATAKEQLAEMQKSQDDVDKQHEASKIQEQLKVYRNASVILVYSIAMCIYIYRDELISPLKRQTPGSVFSLCR